MAGVRSNKKDPPLILGVKCSNYRATDPDAAEKDAAFREPRKKVLERDRYTCRFCGFTSRVGQEVHHVNDDHGDHSLGNLVTTCTLCHMVFHFGLAGRRGVASLIWCPELKQTEINHLVRTCAVALSWSQKMDDVSAAKRAAPTNTGGSDLFAMARDMVQTAHGITTTLASRRANAEDLLGTSDPTIIADLLLAMEPDQYANRERFLKGIRLYPHTDAISSALVDQWASPSGPMQALRPNIWPDLRKNLEKTLGHSLVEA